MLRICRVEPGICISWHLIVVMLAMVCETKFDVNLKSGDGHMKNYRIWT